MTVQVLTSTPPDECGVAEYAQCLYRGLDVEVLDSGDAWQPGRLSAAISVARRMNGDLAHVQHEWLLYGDAVHNVIPLAALAANVARGGRNVTTMHTVIPPDAVTTDFLERFGADTVPPQLAQVVLGALTRGFCNLSDRVVVHTEGAKACLVDDYGADGVRVVPHGLTPRERTPVEPPVTFRFLGLINRAKGVETLLAALDRLDDVTCEIIGRIEDDRIDDDPRITDTYLESEAYDRLVGDTDVLVLPYTKGDYHAASGVLADAMAHGTAVIVSDIPQLVSEINHRETGLVVPRGDPDELADALEYAAANPGAVDSMAARLHGQARGRSWERTRAKTRQLYEDLGVGG